MSASARTRRTHRPSRCVPIREAICIRLGLERVVKFYGVTGQQKARTGNPRHFGVGVGDAWDHAGIEGCAGQFLVALQLSCYHFRSHMRFMHGLVRQHGLADDVADGEDMRHVGTRLAAGGDDGFTSAALHTTKPARP